MLLVAFLKKTSKLFQCEVKKETYIIPKVLFSIYTFYYLMDVPES